MDDDIYEFSENLFAQLSFVTAAERVSIDPENAQVEIEDEDGKFYIKFTSYSRQS